MTKEHYMALADFQTLWTNKIKPTIPTANVASVQEATAAANELT